MNDHVATAACENEPKWEELDYDYSHWTTALYQRLVFWVLAVFVLQLPIDAIIMGKCEKVNCKWNNNFVNNKGMYTMKRRTVALLRRFMIDLINPLLDNHCTTAERSICKMMATNDSDDTMNDGSSMNEQLQKATLAMLKRR